MQTVVTAAEMSAMDKYSINTLGIPGPVLMENAGSGILCSVAAVCGNIQGKTIHIYCGPGNNGGDGFVAARHLLILGARVLVFVVASREKIKGDARLNLTILENSGFQVSFIQYIPVHEKPDCVIDAILGTGVSGPLKDFFAECVEYINSLGVPVIAVDIPTGVNADTGAVFGPVIKAVRTATMALPKRGLLFSPGREYCGKIDVLDIGMPKIVVEKNKSHVWLLEKADILAIMPKRTPDAHKNRCGTVALIAGSTGFTGAASLSSMAVLRSGAGLCYLAVPKSLNAIFETKLTEVITWPVEDNESGYIQGDCSLLLDQVNVQNVTAIGPGLGQHGDTRLFLKEFIKHITTPLVLDADALNLCAADMNVLSDYPGQAVLTPHPGEFSRLTGLTVKEITNNKIDLVRRYTKKWNHTIVLKGGPTIIGTPEGNIFINSTGNAGMATAGSGDVLTGIIASFIAQGLTTEQAAIAGVYIHGLAGDIAQKQFGEMGMTAGDILAHVPEAILQIMR